MTVSPPLGGVIADQFGMAALFPLVFICYGVGVMGMCLVRGEPPLPASEEGAARTIEAAQVVSTRGRAWTAGFGAYDAALRSPTVRLLLLHSLVVYIGVHLALSFAPLYLRDVYAYDATSIGWAGSAASAGAALLLLAIERLRRRKGPIVAMWCSCGLLALHFIATVLSPLLPVQLFGFFVRGGLQTAATLTTVVLADAVSRQSLGPAIALFATVAGLAAIAAPPVGGALYAWAPAGPFLIGTLLLGLSLPLATVAFRAGRANV
jgi:MFS family permease